MAMADISIIPIVEDCTATTTTTINAIDTTNSSTIIVLLYYIYILPINTHIHNIRI